VDDLYRSSVHAVKAYSELLRIADEQQACQDTNDNTRLSALALQYDEAEDRINKSLDRAQEINQSLEYPTLDINLERAIHLADGFGMDTIPGPLRKYRWEAVTQEELLEEIQARCKGYVGASNARYRRNESESTRKTARETLVDLARDNFPDFSSLISSAMEDNLLLDFVKAQVQDATSNWMKRGFSIYAGSMSARSTMTCQNLSFC
jgi:hypothetical protein